MSSHYNKSYLFETNRKLRETTCKVTHRMRCRSSTKTINTTVQNYRGVNRRAKTSESEVTKVSMNKTEPTTLFINVLMRNRFMVPRHTGQSCTPLTLRVCRGFLIL